MCKINDSVFIYTASNARDGRVLFVCEASAVDRNILVELAIAPLGLISLQVLGGSLNLEQRNACYSACRRMRRAQLEHCMVIT